MPATISLCILHPQNQANYEDILWVSPQKATDKKGRGKPGPVQQGGLHIFTRICTGSGFILRYSLGAQLQQNFDRDVFF